MRKLVAILFILALAGAAFYFGFYKRLHRDLAASIFPEDTVVYVAVQDLNKARENFKRTTLGKHIQQPERKKKYERLMQSLFRSAENAAGFDPVPALDQFEHQIAAGLFPVPSGKYAAGFVGVLKDSDEFRLFLEQKMDPALKRRYPDLRKTSASANGITYYTYSSKSMPPGYAPSYYIESSMFVFSHSEEGLRRLAGVHKAGNAALKTNKVFQDAGKEVETRGLHMFVNVRGILKIVNQAVPPGFASFWPGVVKVAGLNSVRSFSYALWIDGESFEEQAFLDVSPDRQGLIKIWLSSPPKVLTGLDYFPSGTANVSAATMPDLDKLWEELNARTKEILDPQRQKQWEQGQSLLRGLLNFDLKRDLVEPIGDEFAASYQPAVSPSDLQHIKFLFAIKLRNLDQFRITVSRAVALAEARGLERSQSSYKGRDLTSFSFNYGTISTSPTFTYDQHWFLFGSSPDLLKQALDSKDGKDRITESGSFKKATVGFPEKVNGISYTDVSVLLRSYSELFRKSERGKEASDLMGDLDPASELNELAKILHPTGSFTRIEKNGVIIRTHSSIPSGFLVFPPLIQRWIGYQ